MVTGGVATSRATITESTQRRFRSAKAENRKQCLINTPEFLGSEMAGDITEAGSVDCADLFDQHSRSIPIDFDFGSKRGRSGRP